MSVLKDLINNLFKKIFRKIHILQNIYLKNKYFLKKKSYSMDGEDIQISKFFKDKTNGFYVDVGCYHPIHRSNTYLLYKKKWRGINIDISEFSIELFNFLRPDDLNYHCAVSNKKEKIKFYFQKELSQLSTIDENVAKTVFQGKIKEKEIEAYTLDEILEIDKYKSSKIDFLNIDVEGADYKVLKGFSFEKFKPELVCIEIYDKNIKESKIYKFLKKKKYKLIWSGVLSHLFKRI